jgi:L-malate glycosyltransferase
MTESNFHILHAFSTFGTGGPQVRLAAIINSLGDRFRHTIMAMDKNFAAAGRIERNICVRLQLPPRKPKIRPYFIELLDTLREVRPDLLVTYNWGSMDVVAAGRWLSLCPMIHHEHGFGIDEAVNLRRRRVWARRFLLNGIHRTIVPSKTLLKLAIDRYRLAPSKVRYISNGVDTNKFRPVVDRRLRHELQVADDELLLGYVGGLRDEKNLTLLLRAFAGADLPKSKLALVGDGSCRSDLEALARSLSIEDRVLFLGVKEQTPSYLAAMDLFVMSSVSEQMPVALLEAMSCGLPALCTDVGDTAELLGNGTRQALVQSGSLEAYKRALRTLAFDSGLRKRLGAENRQRCLRDYSLEQMVRGYEAEYYAAIGSRKVSTLTRYTNNHVRYLRNL